MEAKSIFSIWNHHKWLSQLFPIHLNAYVIGLWPLEIILLLQCGFYPVDTKKDRVYFRISSELFIDGIRKEIWMSVQQTALYVNFSSFGDSVASSRDKARHVISYGSAM